jgi:RimJ/RimL family protein N-acetyltransferase
MKDVTNWQPCMRPTRTTLTGRYCRLEPLDPTHHGDELFAASMAPGAAERFRYLLDAPQNRAEFDDWLAWASASEDPMFFAVVDLGSKRCEGRQALMRIAPEHGVIEVGSILWGPAIARTRLATEAFYLFARYVFNDLGYRRFEWKCDARNEPSRRAAARFGFTYEGTFRQHMVVKGENRDTAWFALLDIDWPTISKSFEQWLDPSNFEPLGRQKTRLEDFRKLE